LEAVNGSSCANSGAERREFAAARLHPTKVNHTDGTAEPETEPAKPGKRRSMWKRTKSFVRRLLLCCA